MTPRNLKSAKPALVKLVGYIGGSSMEAGAEIAGIYRGKFTAGKHDSTIYKIELTDASVPVVLDGEDVTAKPGDLIGLYGNGSLDGQFDTIGKNSFVQITYNGQNEMKSKDKKKNGKLAYDFTVNYDDAGADPVDFVDEDDSL